jgi:factor associated with neutral sphingomyelinase activation
MLKVFDIDHGTEVVAYAVDSDFNCLAFEGQFLLGGCEDGALRLWDVVQGNQMVELPQHEGPIKAVQISDDGKRVLTAGEDQTVVVWGLA